MRRKLRAPRARRRALGALPPTERAHYFVRCRRPDRSKSARRCAPSSPSARRHRMHDGAFGSVERRNQPIAGSNTARSPCRIRAHPPMANTGPTTDPTAAGAALPAPVGCPSSETCSCPGQSCDAATGGTSSGGTGGTSTGGFAGSAGTASNGGSAGSLGTGGSANNAGSGATDASESDDGGSGCGCGVAKTQTGAVPAFLALSAALARRSVRRRRRAD
jgi:hypothetical protein